MKKSSVTLPDYILIKKEIAQQKIVPTVILSALLVVVLIIITLKILQVYDTADLVILTLFYLSVVTIGAMFYVKNQQNNVDKQKHAAKLIMWRYTAYLDDLHKIKEVLEGNALSVKVLLKKYPAVGIPQRKMVAIINKNIARVQDDTMLAVLDEIRSSAEAEMNFFRKQLPLSVKENPVFNNKTLEIGKFIAVNKVIKNSVLKRINGAINFFSQGIASYEPFSCGS